MALLLLAVVLAIVLGNFHVVSGAPGLLVSRTHFGGEDAFASISDCTDRPWMSAVAEHGPLCRALQKAGLLESDFEMQERVRQEVLQESQRITDEIMKQQQELLRQYQ